tara:strand:+ start:460 stop:654 length:195 start_codon:yes stop_codon:yes gene_type:complete
MISKIYGSNKILFPIGSRKGKTKKQIALMVERKKHKKYQDLEKQRRLIREINEERNKWKKGDKK